MKEQIDGLDCKNCLHHFACLVNSEYVPTPCPAYGDKEGYRKQEWISVEDRLPERKGRYLVYIPNEQLICCMYYDCDASVYGDNGVTHWMPLPETPKMKGESK